MLPFVWGLTVRHGKVDVVERQVVVIHRSKAVMENGTVLRRAGMRRAAGAVLAISLPVVSQVRDQSPRAILRAGRCVILPLKDVTTSCTALMAVMRRTALCVNLEHSIVTVIDVCLRHGAVMVRWTARTALMK